MPFKLEVLRGLTAYDISAGQSIALENLDDLGGASVRVIEERGPYQDGASHLGYRLEPRTMTLRLIVQGGSASALDGYRDTLNAMFKPVRGVPITLKLTRDDGKIRQLECERIGPATIPLNKTDRPGNVHRAVVQLRAADPLPYDPTLEEAVLAVPTTDWWLGYGAIGSANVLEHVEAPGTGQLWANTGSVAAGSPHTIFFRSGSATPTTTSRYAFEQNGNGEVQLFRALSSIAGGYQYLNGASGTAAFMSSGTANYLMITNGGTSTFYRDNVLLSTNIGVSEAIEAAAAAGTARWRSGVAGGTASSWPVALPFAAIFNIALSPSQRAGLQQSTTTSGSALTLALAYEGDYDTYPVITVNGPFGNPVITNTTTNDVLNFTGGTIGSADYWTIDTRYGRKRAVNAAGSSIMRYLSEDSDLATFRIAADPIATGGTNVITVNGTATGTATAVNIAYYNRYIGF